MKDNNRPFEYNLLAIVVFHVLKEGDIGGYPIPQYRKKKWKIPKYRVQNRLNTCLLYTSDAADE